MQIIFYFFFLQHWKSFLAFPLDQSAYEYEKWFYNSPDYFLRTLTQKNEQKWNDTHSSSTTKKIWNPRPVKIPQISFAFESERSLVVIMAQCEHKIEFFFTASRSHETIVAWIKKLFTSWYEHFCLFYFSSRPDRSRKKLLAIFDIQQDLNWHSQSYYPSCTAICC